MTLKEWDEAERRFNPDLLLYLLEHDHVFEDWPENLPTNTYEEAVRLFSGGEGLDDDGWPILDVQ